MDKSKTKQPNRAPPRAPRRNTRLAQAKRDQAQKQALLGPRRPPPKKQPLKEPSADKLLHTAGQRGTDVRAPQKQTKESVQKNLIVAGYTQTLPVVAECPDRAISYVAMGIVLHAIKNGYQWKATSTGICPYNAFRRIIDVIRTCMDGSVPLLSNAPAWFWNLLTALKPKLVPFKTGYIRYDWQFTSSGQGDNVAFNLASINPYVLFWGVAGLSETTVNGFNLLTPPPIVTEEAQIESLQDLFAWFETGGHPLVQGPDLNMEKDSSAFAACYPELGESFFSPGAIKVTTYSERQVDCPVLAKFAYYQPLTSSESSFRGWQKGGTSGGSTCYLGARVPELQTIDDWRNKTSPTFKFYNFDEFFEVLSFTIGMALEDELITVGSCPLTAFQVQMILRQSMIPFFSNEFAQDIMYSDQWEALTPFVVGPNGMASGQYSMNVPMFFAENVRSVSRVTTRLSSRYGSNRQIQDLIPVLGRYIERPQLGNYTYEKGGSTFSIYAVDPQELPVSLVDLSSTIDQNVVYLDANGRNTASLIAMWNEWLTKLTKVLSGQVPLVPAQGAPALLSTIYTNMQVTIDLPGDVAAPAPGVAAAKGATTRSTSKKTRYGSAPVTVKQSTVQAVAGSSYFNRVGDVRITAQLGIYEALAPYIKLMVLPVNKPSHAEVSSTSFQSVQAWQVEPGFLNRSSALGEDAGVGTWGTLVSAEARHRQMAAIDVKSSLSDGDNEMIAGLRKLSETGGGGFFTAIADVIGGVTGLPLGPIARMIEGQ